MLDAAAAVGETRIDAGVLVLRADEVMIPPGSAVRVGDGTFGADGFETDDLILEHSGQLHPSVPVTIEDSGLLYMEFGADQTIDHLTLIGGLVTIGGRLTFGRIDALMSTELARLDCDFELNGTHTVNVENGDGVVFNGWRYGDAATFVKEGPGRARVNWNVIEGAIDAVVRDGTLELGGVEGPTFCSLEVGVPGGDCDGAAPVVSFVPLFGFNQAPCDWDVLPCGTIDVNGNEATAVDVVMTGGTLDVDGGEVSADTLTVGPDATVDLGAGGLVDIAVSIDFAGTLTGTGTVTLDGEVVTDGLIDPGDSPGAIAVRADLRQTANGSMHLEIAGTAPSQYDHIDATGDVALEGGTITIEFIDGFVPAPGDTFPLVTGATLTVGDVDVIAPDGYEVDIESGVLALVGADCPEDLNGSGAVDFADVLALLGAWGSAGGPEDLDGSGTVDFGDILVILAAWGPCA